MAVGVRVDPVLIIFFSEANNCIHHTELEDFQTSFDLLLLEWREAQQIVLNGIFYHLELTLRLHVLNVYAHNCYIILLQVHTLKFPLEC